MLLTTVVVVVRRPLSSWVAKHREVEEEVGEEEAPSKYSQPSTEYSAYLHYCLADSQYVQQVVAPALQASSPGSRLCLHHQHLPPDTTIGAAIATAVSHTRCLIILASPAYFASSIPGYELPDNPGESSLLRLQHS